MNELAMDSVFRDERTKYVVMRSSPTSLTVTDTVDRLWLAAQGAVRAENSRGGEARGVVADTAHALGVNIDEGDGHRWDRYHMGRVVVAARKLRDELENLRLTTAEDQRVLDANSELIMFLSRDVAQLTNERDEARRALDVSALGAARDFDDIDALKATIVRQANEITVLKGESA